MVAVIRSGANSESDYPLKLWKLRRVARQLAPLLRALLLQNPKPTSAFPKDFALRAACAATAKPTGEKKEARRLLHYIYRKHLTSGTIVLKLRNLTRNIPILPNSHQ